MKEYITAKFEMQFLLTFKPKMLKITLKKKNFDIKASRAWAKFKSGLTKCSKFLYKETLTGDLKFR